MLFTLGGVTAVGVYLIYKVAPYESFTYDEPGGTTVERKNAKFFGLILGATGFSVGLMIFALLLSRDISPMTASSSVFLALGVSLLPSAYFAWKDNDRVNKIDQELPTVLRALGSVAGSAGVTLTESLRRIDLNSYQYIKIPLERLRTRLEAQLPSKESWEIFRRETGSELASRTTGMFVDGVEVGCNPGQIGEICSDYAQDITELRAKRKLTSSTFSFLTVTMHTVMSFILVFVLEIIMNFNQKLSDVVQGQDVGANASLKVPDNITAPPGISIPQSQDLSAGLDVFQMTNMGSLQYTIIFAIAILTLANALAPKFSEGGHNIKILTYLAVTSIASGVILLIVPKITASLLNM
jgi:flagellar protein FlaJ